MIYSSVEISDGVFYDAALLNYVTALKSQLS